MKQRCQWAGNDPLYQKYHDEEWGVPLHDDQKLFEMLCLEGAQAGLSWIIILRKRENYRKAFSNFDAKKIAQYDSDKVERLLQNEGIVRNKLKVAAFITNAKCFLEVQKEFGSFDKYIWQFTGGKQIINH
jgi:DNA-3-methyladenine glycosylase I